MVSPPALADRYAGKIAHLSEPSDRFLAPICKVPRTIIWVARWGGRMLTKPVFACWNVGDPCLLLTPGLQLLIDPRRAMSTLRIYANNCASDSQCIGAPQQCQSVKPLVLTESIRHRIRWVERPFIDQEYLPDTGTLEYVFFSFELDIVAANCEFLKTRSKKGIYCLTATCNSLDFAILRY